MLGIYSSTSLKAISCKLDSTAESINFLKYELVKKVRNLNEIKPNVDEQQLDSIEAYIKAYDKVASRHNAIYKEIANKVSIGYSFTKGYNLIKKEDYRNDLEDLAGRANSLYERIIKFEEDYNSEIKGLTFSLPEIFTGILAIVVKELVEYFKEKGCEMAIAFYKDYRWLTFEEVIGDPSEPVWKDFLDQGCIKYIE